MNERESEKEAGPAHAEGETRDEQERDVERSRREQSGSEPHGELSSSASDPDPSEYPDPFEDRKDPRGPDADEEDGGTPRAPSTSEPPTPQSVDKEHYEGWEQ